jgi:hypothetical protein
MSANSEAGFPDCAMAVASLHFALSRGIAGISILDPVELELNVRSIFLFVTVQRPLMGPAVAN